MTDPTFETNKWLHELARRDAERAHDSETNFSRSANEAAVKSGLETVKTIILINGGAAISLLAFIGGLGAQGKLTSMQMHDIADRLIPFGWGVAVGTLSLALGYLTNLAMVSVSNSRARIESHPFVEDGVTTHRWRCLMRTLRFFSMLASVLSIGMFLYGLFEVKDLISRINFVTDIIPPVQVSSGTIHCEICIL